jgi:hypothetical protein
MVEGIVGKLLINFFFISRIFVLSFWLLGSYVRQNLEFCIVYSCPQKIFVSRGSCLNLPKELNICEYVFPHRRTVITLTVTHAHVY